MIGIIGAMDIEVDGLKAVCTNIKTETVGTINFITGDINGCEVVIAKAGIGKVNAAICTEAMILKYSPDCIINTGVAGSLTPELNIGDIVIADSVCQHDFDTSPLGDPKGLIPEANLVKIPSDKNTVALLEKAVSTQAVSYKTGTIASGDVFVADSSLKDNIVEAFGALACEMEGASIGQVAYLNKVPFAVLRALSDSANEGSCSDYPTFCKKAAEVSVNVILEFLKLCNN